VIAGAVGVGGCGCGWMVSGCPLCGGNDMWRMGCRLHVAACGVLHCVDHQTGGRLDEEALRVLLRSHTPNMAEANDELFRRLFLVMDIDGSGTLDFKEFALGLNTFVKGDLMEKVGIACSAVVLPPPLLLLLLLLLLGM